MLGSSGKDNIGLALETGLIICGILDEMIFVISHSSSLVRSINGSLGIE